MRDNWFKIILAVCAVAITLTIVIPNVDKMLHDDRPACGSMELWEHPEIPCWDTK